jgi:hypothetical protein
MYKIIDNVVFNEKIVQRLKDGASIPINLENNDYVQFKKDLADGAELFDAEGNVIDGIAYLATLES